MVEKRAGRLLRLVGITCLLLLTASAWQFMGQPQAAHAATPPNTIFTDTSTNNTIAVKTTNSSGSISYTITNFNGTQVGSGGPLSVSNGQVTVTLPQEPDDYYTLNVTDNTVSPAATQPINFTVVAPFTPSSSSPFGVGTHFRDGVDPNLDPVIQNLGSGFIRDDMTWQVIEQTPGVYDFSSDDPWMNALHQQGLTPLVILDYGNSNYDSGNFPYDTAGLTAFANYVKAVVNHYPWVQYVEVYNEYGGGSLNCTGSAGATCYTNLAKYTYQAAKSVRSNITVFGGSTGGLDLNWETNLFQDGILSYLDGLSIHPYTAGQGAAPETGSIDAQVLSTESLIRQYNNGQPKPIWITELGWPTCCSRVDEATQAAYVVRGGTLALAGGAQKYILYDFLDGGTNPTYTEDHFGVLRLQNTAGSYTPKPSYTAYAVMARQLANETFETSQNQSINNSYDEVFSQNGADNLRVLWTTGGATNTTLNATGPLTVVSMMGGSQTVQPVNGQVTLTLSGNPIYVRGAATVPAQPIINNPGFERGSTSGWATYNGATVIASNQRSGSYALQLGASSSGADQTITGLTPNTSYVLCGWAKVANAGEVVKVAGVKAYGGTEESVQITNTSYQQGCSTFTTGATNTSADIYCYKDPGGTGVAYCDDYTLGPKGGSFSSGFENGDAQPTWSNSVDNAGYPAGGSQNVSGVCCGLSGPEAHIDNGQPDGPHTGSYALLYSGAATKASGPDYAYMQVFNLSSQSVTIDAGTTLSYWVYPESAAHSYNYASGSNSTCVAVDLIFSDNTNLRDSGALDQHGNGINPGNQCKALTLDTWNHVTVNLGSYVNGKTAMRLDLGYDQANVTGGYRGYLDDVSITG